MKKGRKNNRDSGKLLGDREVQVLKLLCMKCMTYKEAAKELFISSATVKTHARNIYKKLGVKNSVQAGNKFFGKMKGQNKLPD